MVGSLLASLGRLLCLLVLVSPFVASGLDESAPSGSQARQARTHLLGPELSARRLEEAGCQGPRLLLRTVNHTEGAGTSRRLARRLQEEIHGLQESSWALLDQIGIMIATMDCNSSVAPEIAAAKIAENYGDELDFVEVDSRSLMPVQAFVHYDPFFQYQWGMSRIGIPDAWTQLQSMGTTPQTVVVAVLDTGFNPRHEDFAGRAWTNRWEVPDNGLDDDGNGYVDDYYGYDFVRNVGRMSDPDGHGTHIAGTVAANADNLMGVVGVAGLVADVQIMALRMVTLQGGYVSDSVSALNYAIAMGVPLATSSWGSSNPSDALQAALVTATAQGMVFVAAAGNTGESNDYTRTQYPCSYDTVLCVCAVDGSDQIPYWSSWGVRTVQIAAPGEGIVGAWGTGNRNYQQFSGTSASSPHVAGAMALFYSVLGSTVLPTMAAVKNLTLVAAARLPSLNRRIGGGRLDLLAMIKLVQQQLPSTETSSTKTVTSLTTSSSIWSTSSTYTATSSTSSSTSSTVTSTTTGTSTRTSTSTSSATSTSSTGTTTSVTSSTSTSTSSTATTSTATTKTTTSSTATETTSTSSSTTRSSTTSSTGTSTSSTATKTTSTRSTTTTSTGTSTSSTRTETTTSTRTSTSSTATETTSTTSTATRTSTTTTTTTRTSSTTSTSTATSSTRTTSTATSTSSTSTSSTSTSSSTETTTTTSSSTSSSSSTETSTETSSTSSSSSTSSTSTTATTTTQVMSFISAPVAVSVISSSLILAGTNDTDVAMNQSITTSLAVTLQVPEHAVNVVALTPTRAAVFAGGRRQQQEPGPGATRRTFSLTMPGVKADFEVQIQEPGISSQGLGTGVNASEIFQALENLYSEPSNFTANFVTVYGASSLPANFRVRITLPTTVQVQASVIAGPWGACGGGRVCLPSNTSPTQTRDSWCASPTNVALPLSPSLCAGLPAPRTVRPCPPGKGVPPTCGWRLSTWSTCNSLASSSAAVFCNASGVGSQVRSVQCAGAVGVDCLGPPPAGWQSCGCAPVTVPSSELSLAASTGLLVGAAAAGMGLCLLCCCCCCRARAAKVAPKVVEEPTTWALKSGKLTPGAEEEGKEVQLYAVDLTSSEVDSVHSTATPQSTESWPSHTATASEGSPLSASSSLQLSLAEMRPPAASAPNPETLRSATSLLHSVSKGRTLLNPADPRATAQDSAGERSVLTLATSPASFIMHAATSAASPSQPSEEVSDLELLAPSVPSPSEPSALPPPRAPKLPQPPPAAKLPTRPQSPLAPGDSHIPAAFASVRRRPLGLEDSTSSSLSVPVPQDASPKERGPEPTPPGWQKAALPPMRAPKAPREAAGKGKGLPGAPRLPAPPGPDQCRV